MMQRREIRHGGATPVLWHSRSFAATEHAGDRASRLRSHEAAKATVSDFRKRPLETPDISRSKRNPKAISGEIRRSRIALRRYKLWQGIGSCLSDPFLRIETVSRQSSPYSPSPPACVIRLRPGAWFDRVVSARAWSRRAFEARTGRSPMQVASPSLCVAMEIDVPPMPSRLLRITTEMLPDERGSPRCNRRAAAATRVAASADAVDVRFAFGLLEKIAVGGSRLLTQSQRRSPSSH
jgi:hypothetical protein